jgi:hypothetical protein
VLARVLTLKITEVKLYGKEIVLIFISGKEVYVDIEIL